MTDARPVGAILAGGGSTRMGQPKHAMILPDGRTMIRAVADAMAPLCDRMVVAGPPDALPDCAHIADLRSQQGPLAGIEAILADGRSDAVYLVCACDTPLVTTSLLQLLLTPGDRPATFLSIGVGEPEPLPARIDAAALPVVRSLLDEGRRSLHQFMRQVEHDVAPAPESAAVQFTNVNTPEEYERLAASLNQ